MKCPMAIETRRPSVSMNSCLPVSSVSRSEYQTTCRLQTGQWTHKFVIDTELCQSSSYNVSLQSNNIKTLTSAYQYQLFYNTCVCKRRKMARLTDKTAAHGSKDG